MLGFVDATETKGYGSLVMKEDVSVETFDVTTCSEGPILRVDVAIDTISLNNQVGKACGTTSLIFVGRCGN